MANQYEPNGGRQVGGGPERSDQQAGGGSSGTGGYGKIQDRMQGREEQAMWRTSAAIRSSTAAKRLTRSKAAAAAIKA
jgi:hypothetical protein